MARSFADNFGWIQKSEEFRNTLDRAFAYASARSHKMVMLEHLLLALVEDSDAQMVMYACKVDPLRLKTEVSQLMHTQFGPLVEQNAVPLVSEAFQKVLTHAAAACEQSGRPYIDGAIVLAALIGEGSSPAAEILKLQGMTFDEAINNLGRKGGPSREQQPSVRDQGGANGLTLQPRLSENYSYQLDPSVENILSNVRDIIGAEPSNNTANLNDSSLQSVAAGSYSDARIGNPNPGRARLQGQSFGQEANGSRNGLNYSQNFSGVHNEKLGSATANRTQNDLDYPTTYGNSGSPRLHSAATQIATKPDYQSPNFVQPQQSEYESIVHTAQLIETIPRRMKCLVQETVEVSIVRAGVAEIEHSMNRSVNSGTDMARRAMEAMTVQLRSPLGGFQIENVSPETQWIDNNLGFSDEYAKWRWKVTPVGRGKQRLDLVISARQVGSQGILSENALPEQVIEVKVRGNYLRGLFRILKWSVVALLGAAVALYGETVYQMISQFI